MSCLNERAGLIELSEASQGDLIHLMDRYITKTKTLGKLVAFLLACLFLMEHGSFKRHGAGTKENINKK